MRGRGVWGLGLRAWSLGAALAMLAACGSGVGIAVEEDQPIPEDQQIAAVRTYIKEGWQTLRRSHEDLLDAAIDPKVDREAGQPWIIYVSRKEDPQRVRQKIEQALPPEEAGQLEVRVLPEDGRVEQQGLLYLPHPYVVPGGRFNEMYGWDSYFIQVGLLLDGELELARNMADNFIYQIEHYETILNANRTYYLTRSQPPFLTQMIWGVYQQTQNRPWLRSTLPAIEKYYSFWTSAPHLTEATGLSRYYDLGEGPAPEVVADERDDRGRTHYDRVREYYRTHQVDAYPLEDYYDANSDSLTPLFYKGDRSMRESGFDPSNRFGPFNADIIRYNPVCLNSLLYAMENQTARILDELGEAAAAGQWRSRAGKRLDLVNQYLWDEEEGLYFDYNFETGERRQYEFATTFYPLWVGLSDARQAARVAANLDRFEADGGLLTSTRETGNQWDAPFGWAPLHMIAVQGLERQGYQDHADRLASKFISLVNKEFAEHSVIVEKYDVVRRESDVAQGIRFGYSSNEIGFGWTNAVYLALLR